MAHFGALRLARRAYMFVYGEPLFRSRCTQFGSECFIWTLPVVNGPARLNLGDRVSFWGYAELKSPRPSKEPAVTLADNVNIGHRVTIEANRQVILEEGVMVANDCYITDTGSPWPDGKAAILQPVRICRNAWLGAGCTIHRGVTVGEGAIVGPASVVINDIPPFTVAMGNPARVIGSARPQARTTA
jgi:acetyltransferase-like isoleucine patch superfamily enzyme